MCRAGLGGQGSGRFGRWLNGDRARNGERRANAKSLEDLGLNCSWERQQLVKQKGADFSEGTRVL